MDHLVPSNPCTVLDKVACLQSKYSPWFWSKLTISCERGCVLKVCQNGHVLLSHISSHSCCSSYVVPCCLVGLSQASRLVAVTCASAHEMYVVIISIHMQFLCNLWWNFHLTPYFGVRKELPPLLGMWAKQIRGGNTSNTTKQEWVK
jgi:hypothetical protein